MSQSHEPSYYEIALTNRQVLTVFIVLLVCVVAAFFSGVWIGRRGAGPGGQAQVAELVPADEAGEAGSQPVKELRFFSDEPRQTAAGRRSRGAVEPRPETTLREDLAGEDAPPPIESPPAPQPQPQPERVAAKPPVAAADGARSPVAAPAAGASEPGAGELVIQVFFSSDEEKARALVERLGGSGYPAFLSPVRVGLQTMYRVRVGPYSERAEAEAIASKVQRAFKLDTWITQ